MSLEIAWKQNILVKDYNLLELLLVVLGFGSLTDIHLWIQQTKHLQCSPQYFYPPQRHSRSTFFVIRCYRSHLMRVLKAFFLLNMCAYTESNYLATDENQFSTYSFMEPYFFLFFFGDHFSESLSFLLMIIFNRKTL